MKCLVNLYTKKMNNMSAKDNLVLAWLVVAWSVTFQQEQVSCAHYLK